MTVARPTTAKAQRSSAGAFATPAARRRYVIVVVVLLALSAVSYTHLTLPTKAQV